jgi:restriction system protein
VNFIDVIFNNISSILRTFLITLIIILTLIRINEIIGFIKESRSKSEHIEDLKLGILNKRDLYNYTPIEFEHWCAEFLEKQGFVDIDVTPSADDGGKDIVCSKGKDTYYIECKRYSYLEDAEFKVNLETARKLIGTMEEDDIRNGLIITSGYADKEAIEYLNTLPKDYKVGIIDGDDLLTRYSSIRHLIYAQEKPTS